MRITWARHGQGYVGAVVIGAHTKQKIILARGRKSCRPFVGLAALLEPYRVGRARAVLPKKMERRRPQKRRNRMQGRQKHQVTTLVTKMHALIGKWDAVYCDRN